MKILLINYEYPPLGGGGGIFCRYLAEELCRQGHSVDILTSQYQNLLNYENNNNLTIYRVKVLNRQHKEKASLLSLISFPFFSIIQGIKLCRQKKYHIINTHFAIPSGPTGFILSKIFRIKNILSIHGADIYDPTRNIHNNFILKKVIKLMLRWANYVIAQSQNIKIQAELLYGVKNKIKIVPLGIPIPQMPTPKKEARLFRFIGIGRLVPRKGFNFLIKAMPLNSELIIIGEGPEKPNLQEIARQENKKVFFTGNIKDQEKWQWLANADCFVLSSLHEGFALVCLEAMAAGLPIVATNFGGQTDHLAENINALLVKPKNISGLHWALEKIQQDNNLREKIANNNIRTVENYYITGVTLNYLKIFQNAT